MVLIGKKAIFDILFTCFSHQGKMQKLLQHISHIHTHILLTVWTFFALPILQKLWIYHVWFLFGATPGVDSYSHDFGAINKIMSNFKLECLLPINVYTNANFVVICKQQTLNDSRWRLSSIQKMKKKALLLCNSHFALYR